MTTFIQHFDCTADLGDLADRLAELGVTEADCVAVRVHREDGTFGDWVWGGTEAERDAARAALGAGLGGNVH